MVIPSIFQAKKKRGEAEAESTSKLRYMGMYVTAGWWFGTFLIFPYIGYNHPNWLIFFRGVQTTNQTVSNRPLIITKRTLLQPPKADLGSCVTGSEVFRCGLRRAVGSRGLGRLYDGTDRDWSNTMGTWWGCNKTSQLWLIQIYPTIILLDCILCSCWLCIPCPMMSRLHKLVFSHFQRADPINVIRCFSIRVFLFHVSKVRKPGNWWLGGRLFYLVSCGLLKSMIFKSWSIMIAEPNSLKGMTRKCWARARGESARLTQRNMESENRVPPDLILLKSSFSLVKQQFFEI